MAASHSDLLVCPVTHEPLTAENGTLVSRPSGRRYEVNAAGIPLFAREWMSEEARVQEAHYDRIAKVYLENLSYPHTEEYMAYFDRAVLEQIDGPLDTIAEICCGAGEACALLKDRIGRGVGIDISTAMLDRARRRFPEDRFEFAQGDACRLPLRDGAFDAVFMLGGVHHVNDRKALFSELFRVLKPGGRFYFREPLDDFILWRLARDVIYRLSPTLDEDTEKPLRRDSTIAQLTAAGFRATRWRSIGFVGSCFLMNSDVLVFNRLFRFLPGIRPLTRLMTRVDDASLRLPGLRNAGVAVVGVATRP
jgi:ubiquinone/menaquinone biosynthesis C-methylase UbiE